MESGMNRVGWDGPQFKRGIDMRVTTMYTYRAEWNRIRVHDGISCEYPSPFNSSSAIKYPSNESSASYYMYLCRKSLESLTSHQLIHQISLTPRASTRGVSNLGAGLQGSHRANNQPARIKPAASQHLPIDCPFRAPSAHLPICLLSKLQLLSRVPEEIGRSVHQQWPPRLFFFF